MTRLISRVGATGNARATLPFVAYRKGAKLGHKAVGRAILVFGLRADAVKIRDGSEFD